MAKIPAERNLEPDEDRRAPATAPRPHVSVLGRNGTPLPEPYRVGGHAVVIVSGGGDIVQVLQAPSVSVGVAPDEIEGKSVDAVWPADPPGQLAAYARRAIRSRQVESREIAIESGAGHYDFVFIPSGPDRVMIVARDVSERRQAFSRLERLAYLDGATQLPNQQFLMEELARCIEVLLLQGGRAAVLCFDIRPAGGLDATNHTKDNDLVFVELATRLQHELRGANDLDVEDFERYSVAARVDYGQFGVVLPGIDSGADAESVAARLGETLQQPVSVGDREVKIRARAGIALFPQDGKDADTLFANALTAMEDAAASDADYTFHSGTVRLRALQRQDLEAELRSALENDEFAVEYLPVVAANNRRVVSVEALLRWPQNIFGAQSIQKIVTVAENTGLIRPIGDTVLRKSCEALKRWHASGWTDLRLSVNLSVQEFSREDLPGRLVAILAEYDVDPSYIDVEINEYALFRDAMKDYPRSLALSERGIGIVVDDYGTGACSLAHLSRSPADAIKIDNSFVANIVTDARDRDACSAVISLAQRLGRRVIAEGVETEEQAAVLRDQGCGYLQGFLTCRPTSAAGMLDVLAKRGAK